MANDTNLKNKKILLTGGTGMIGQKLIPELLSRGAWVTVLSRNSLIKSENSPFTVIRHLEEIPEDIDIMINLAGEKIAQRWTAAAQKRIYESRVGLTKSLIEHCKKDQLKKIPLLIQGSAVGYYGFSKKQWTEEECVAPLIENQTSFSQTLCHDWESATQEGHNCFSRVVFLRIGPVLLKGQGFLKELYPLFYLGLGGVFGNGEQIISWIDCHDLISMIIEICINDQINGPVNAVSPHPVTQKEFGQTYSQVLHRPFFMRYPKSFVSMMFGQMGEEMILNGQYVTPKKMLDLGFHFEYEHLETALRHEYRTT